MEDEVNSSVSLRELNLNLEVLASSAVPWMSAQTERATVVGSCFGNLQARARRSSASFAELLESSSEKMSWNSAGRSKAKRR